MYRTIRQFSAVAFVAMSLVSFANAQATRTWVSGVGDDANPCSRTAPCKTFAGAISKTAAGGEIDALDPGGFGGLTVTKSIVIDGGGNLAGVLVAGTNGITVAAGATDFVVLRNIWFDGANGSGLNAISFNSGGTLVVEKCVIFGFSGNGINTALSANGNLSVEDVSITDVADGVHIGGTAGTAIATLKGMSIRRATNGVNGEYGLTNVTNSVITDTTGVAVLSGGTGTVSVTNSLLVGNQVAVSAGTGSTIRLSNNDVYDNQTGFACGGGTLATAGNNRKAGNVGGSLPVCTPTVTMTIQ